jgi:hypothetical protein
MDIPPGEVSVLLVRILRRFCVRPAQLYNPNPQLTALSARSFLGLNGTGIAYLLLTKIVQLGQLTIAWR